MRSNKKILADNYLIITKQIYYLEKDYEKTKDISTKQELKFLRERQKELQKELERF